MVRTLKAKAYHGVLWSAIDAVVARLIQFVIGVILACLLLPEQFGIIGMLAVFIGVAQSFMTSGFGSALIQKKNLDDVDTSSVFYFNIIIGILLSALLYRMAPWIAAFFDEPILLALTRAMSVVVIIGSFGVVQSALLTREVGFKTQTKISLIALAGSGIIGILLAIKGFGVWSLVWQQLSASTVTVLLLWVFNTWRPKLVFSLRSLAGMFSFGWRLLASGLATQVFDNIYNLLIGKLFSAADLGYYTRASRLERLPSMTIAQVVSRVTFPVFSSIQDDTRRLREGLRKTLETVIFVSAPVMVGLAVVATPLVTILLTDKWLPCVLYLKLLCIGGLLRPFSRLNSNVIMAKGRTDLYLRLQVVSKVLTIINILLLWRMGIAALIIGQVGVLLFSQLLTSFFAGRLVCYTLREQLWDVCPYLGVSLLMGAVVYASQYLPIASIALKLGVQIMVGFLVYTTLCGACRLPAFVEGLGFVRRRIFS